MIKLLGIILLVLAFISMDATAGVIIHKSTSNFFDIEAPADQVWVGCTDDDSKESNSIMFFYILDGNISHEFFYRRVYDVAMCLDTEREYHRMIEGSKTVRIVGGMPNQTPGPRPPVTKRVPARFSEVSKIVSRVFLRLQAGDRCKAYFPDDCDLPANYWAGTIPE